MRQSGMRTGAAPARVELCRALVVALACITLIPAAAMVEELKSAIQVGEDYPYGPGGDGKHDRDKKDKLPFRTGAMVALVSPWLEAECDTAADPSPYVPYGPDSNVMGRKGGAAGGVSYPHDGSGDDPAQAMVWCNGTIHTDGRQPYPGGGSDDDDAHGGSWPHHSGGGKQGGSGTGDLVAWLATVASKVTAAAGAAVAAVLGHTAAVQPTSGGEGSVETSQWDMDGFVLMGTDFASADVFSGGKVFLKNQNNRKFCRLAGTGDGGGYWPSGGSADTLTRAHHHDDDEYDNDRVPNSALVCDLMMSGEDAEFVVELVGLEGGDGDNSDEESVKDEFPYGPGGGGDWPSGGDGGKGVRPDGGGSDSGHDSWPGHGDKHSKRTSVLVRLRAPQNDMRYCAPDHHTPGYPILCNRRHPDTSSRAATTFRLTDMAPY